jgi:hypothetical protein
MFRQLLPFINAINSQPSTITPPTDQEMITVNYIQQLKSLIEYFAFVIIEGDYLNDSLTELDQTVVPYITQLGMAVAALFGN